MTTATASIGIEQIGEIAGDVWHVLHATGPQSMSKLLKQVDAPRDQVMQAIGWLAREDKISIQEERRSKIVSLV